MEMTASFTPPPPPRKLKYPPAKHSQSHFCHFSQRRHGNCNPPTPIPAPDHAPCPSAMTNQNDNISLFLVEHCA